MRKAHFIGIAGVGMSATALLLKESGWHVTGSDSECYGPPREVLGRGGISFTLGYDPKNIPADTECFVIGRNAKLAPSENAEVRAALASGKPVFSFPQILGQITQDRSNIVVAGSYGKSTLTALLAHILRHCGIDAGYFIGAEPVISPWLPAPAALGTSSIFVLEGDEYPSSHEDARAKFLHLNPGDILLSSVVHDHVNVYPTLADYEKPFRELLSLIPSDGVVFLCADEPNALALAKESGKRLSTYGMQNPEAEFRASNIRYGARTRFTLAQNDIIFGEIETALLGAHNVENILGVAAYLLARQALPFAGIAAAIADFTGIRRRLDAVAPESRIPVFEGFGSSYEKARAAIVAMKMHFPDKPLVIIFEPHTFGWRNRANLAWYDSIFREAERVFILPPETQGAGTHDQLEQEEILERVGTRAKRYNNPGAAAGALAGNEAVLILTSGSLQGTLPELISEISRAFPI